MTAKTRNITHLAERTGFTKLQN